MSDFCRIASNFMSMSFGAHQLVSELADPLFNPMFESSTRGSSGHGESGGTTTARRRASVNEDRIRSIESTVEVLSGTVFNLSNQFDKIKGGFDRFEERVDNFERMLEELVRSRHDHEFSNPELQQTPFLYYSMAAQSPSPSNQMSNSPVMHTAMSVPEQTTEERIRILTATFQKCKAIEEQPQMYSPSLPKYHTALYMFDEMCEETQPPPNNEDPTSEDPQINVIEADNAMGKFTIDNNNNPEYFFTVANVFENPVMVPGGNSARSILQRQLGIDDLKPEQHQPLVAGNMLVRLTSEQPLEHQEPMLEKLVKVWDPGIFSTYRQVSVGYHRPQKLYPKYLGPYEILEEIGAVAYKLALPVEALIHSVFHVFQLKKQISSSIEVQTETPTQMEGLILEPEVILDRRMVKKNNRAVTEVLVKWKDSDREHAQWILYEKFIKTYPFFDLETRSI